jgi:protein SCO1
MSRRITLALGSALARTPAAGFVVGLAIAAPACAPAPSVPAQAAGESRATGGSVEPAQPAVRELSLDPIVLPAARLVDQDGRLVDLAGDVVGTRVAAIQFVFTRCATSCPILASKFEALRTRLGDDIDKDFALISITVDPEYDHPETLKAWGSRHGAGPGWSLLTGSKTNVDRVLTRLGMPTSDPRNHQSQLVIVDGSTGKGLRTSGLDSVAELAAILRRVRAARPEASPATRSGAADNAPASPREGDQAAQRYFSNTILVDQSGRRLRFYDDLLRDKTVVINVFFSQCTGSCVTMGSTLTKLQERLGDRLERDVRLISISVDSPRDTVAVLAAYASNYGARPGWYFLGGDKAGVDAVLRKLGQYVESREAHGTVMLVGNMRTGLWKKVFGLAAAEQVIEQVQTVIEDQGTS